MNEQANIQQNSLTLKLALKNPPEILSPTTPFLDTLAQLPEVPLTANVNLDGIERLKKRAGSKYFTQKIAVPLALLNSSLKRYYDNAYHCNHTLLQSENTLTAKYCNTRICSICNRVRTAKMINGYSVPLTTLNDKRFVTLTIPNAKAEKLAYSVSVMKKTISNIFTVMQYRKLAYGGLRKTEITYNAIRNDFHPHFHLIINGKDNANLILREWLLRFPSAVRYAQDERPIDDNAMMEMFKYTTKIVSNDINANANLNGNANGNAYGNSNNGNANGNVYGNTYAKTKGRIYIKAIDTIMQVLRRKRIIQPFGSIRKMVSEDVDKLDKQTYPGIPEYDSIEWHWEEHDWINKYGELLTGYAPSEQVERLEVC